MEKIMAIIRETIQSSGGIAMLSLAEKVLLALESKNDGSLRYRWAEEQQEASQPLYLYNRQVNVGSSKQTDVERSGTIDRALP